MFLLLLLHFCVYSFQKTHWYQDFARLDAAFPDDEIDCLLFFLSVFLILSISQC